jgi:gliding motility-associated-like protein
LAFIAISLTVHSQCANSFRLSLSGSKTEFGYDIVEIAGGDLIFAGQTTSFGNGGTDIFLTRISPSGVVLWSKAYGSTGEELLRKLRLALDGNILITGTSNSYEQGVGAAIAMEIDLNGNIVWQNQLEETTGHALGLDILSTTDNGFVVSGTDYAPDNSSDWLLAKLDAAGNLVWTKRLDYDVNEDAFSMIQKGDTLITLGNENGAAGNYAGILAKLAISDGTLYNSSSFAMDGRGVFSGKIQSSSNQYRFSVHIIDGFSYAQMQEGFIMTDQLFNPINYFKINASPYDNFDFSSFFQTADGGFLATGSPTSLTQGYIFKFDAAGNLTFSTEITSGTPFTIYSAIQGSDGSIWAVGSDNGHVSLIKLNASGQFQYCPNLNPSIPLAPTTLTFSPFTWNNVSSYHFQPPSGIFTAKAFSFAVDSICVEPACLITLGGRVLICGELDTVTYYASRTGDCGPNILWSVPVGSYSQQLNDTTIRVRFPGDGSYTVTAAGNDPCRVAQTSLNELVKLSPDSINLGPDTIFCGVGHLLLDAGPGFATYDWQFGNGNQTYYVTQSGVYHVTATNYCQQTFADTIRVLLRSDDSFAVSPLDTTFCTPGPISFNATGGDTYQWSPAAGLSNPAIPNPVALIDTSTNYLLLITDTVCHRSKQFDVSLTVAAPPLLSVSKSNDVDCSTGSAQLKASGAIAYNWSPAATLSSDTVSDPIASPRETTTYFVQGANALGCTTTDSIVVNFTKTGEADFYLPNAFTPNNDGHNDRFRIVARGTFKMELFSVFDRWGQLVFSTKDISQGWDGTCKGSILPAGTYVWELEANNFCAGTVFRMGTVILIR